jgi:hypothetical protein
VADSALYEGEDRMVASSTATVMGMKSGYKLIVYERFVGLLRKTATRDTLFLVSHQVFQEILTISAWRSRLQDSAVVNCTYANDSNNNDIFKKDNLLNPYPDIKIRYRSPGSRLVSSARRTGPLCM